MDNFRVNLTINDVCCNRCNNSSNNTTILITNSSTIIPLQNGFSFRIISASAGRVTVEIRKSFLRYIRFLYINIPTNICLSENSSCYKHIVTIKVNRIEAN